MKSCEFLQKKIWAVLGATDKTEKFGYKIYRHLLSHGYEVYPVNPRVKEIDGNKCYACLKDIPVKIEVVDFVVPELVGLKALEECFELGIHNIWLQPGADRASVVDKAKELQFNVVQSCVLVEVK